MHLKKKLLESIKPTVFLRRGGTFGVSALVCGGKMLETFLDLTEMH